VSNKRKSKRRPPAPKRTEPAPEATTPSTEEPPPRRQGLLSGSMFSSGPSPMPPLARTLGRGFLAVIGQPIIVLVTVALVALAWFALLAAGFEGTPGRLVAVLALPPISTYFDLGTGSAIFGIAPGLLVFLGVTLVLRTLIVTALTGMILESLEDDRVSMYGILRSVRALPTVLAVHVLSFSIIIAGNLILPILGPGIGFLGFVAVLVAGLFFLGFAPAAAIREGRPVLDEIRRSGRAAMLPNARHLMFCALYFFLALPVLVGLAPGGTLITANPTLVTWTFAFVVSVVHVGFMGALAYRWVVVEPAVPEDPVKRRPATKAPAKAPSAKARSRR